MTETEKHGLTLILAQSDYHESIKRRYFANVPSSLEVRIWDYWTEHVEEYSDVTPQEEMEEYFQYLKSLGIKTKIDRVRI